MQEARGDLLEQALDRGDIDGLTRPIVRHGSLATGQDEAQDEVARWARRARHSWRVPISKACDVWPALTFVLDQHAQVTGKHGATQLGVVEGDWVGGADGSRVLGVVPEMGVVIGTDEPVGDDLVQAGTGEQRAQEVDGSPWVRPVRWHGRIGQPSRERLVTLDACDLLDDVGLDGEVAAMLRHDRDQRFHVSGDRHSPAAPGR